MSTWGPTRAVWHRWWPFGLLCMITLLRWNLAEEHRQVSSTLTSQACGLAIAAVVSFVVALITRASRLELSQAKAIIISGALLLGGPTLPSFFIATPVSASALVIALGLIPVVVAVGVGMQRSGGISAASLAAGLAGLAGLLVLLPQPYLGNVATDFLLLAMPLLTGAGCVLIHRGNAGSSVWVVALALAGAAFVFITGATLAIAGIHEVHVETVAIAFDVAVGLLSVLAVLRLAPAQYAAQFILLPALVLVEGWVLFHVPMDARMIAGMGLLATGAALLLRQGNTAQAEAPLSLVP